MKKFIGLVVLAVLVGSLIARYQAIQFGKEAYLMGCFDTSIKLAKLGDVAESVEIEKFCKAREEALDNYLGIL